MRFLMNSPAALTSTAVDSRVPTKLSLDALELSCSRILSGSLAPHPPGLLAWEGQRSDIRRSLNPASQSYSCRDSPLRKLSLLPSTPLVQGTFPIP
jgi:hypothetical protein